LMVDTPTAFSIFPLTLGIALSQARSSAVSGGGGAVVVGAKVVGAAVVLVAWLSAVDQLTGEVGGAGIPPI
jgi:sorbitol-specific phosphotransferase system component IIBC